MKPFSPSAAGRPLRVLIVRIGAMGDVLHALPAVAALRERHPDWFIGWALEPAWSELLEAETDIHGPEWRFAGRNSLRPLVDVWTQVPTKKWKQNPFSIWTLRDIRGLWDELKGDRYDICVDMQGAIRSAVVGRRTGAKVFAGPSTPREAPAAWLYKQKVSLSAEHVVEQGCELLGAAVGEDLRPAKVELPTNREAKLWCDRLLAGDERPFLLMAPTAGWGAKQWPAERYGAVAAELAQAGYRTLVNASSQEDETGNRVVSASSGAATLVPCSLAQLIALTRRASLVIGGDTGPLHLAAALEKPVVGLYGPTDPERNGPWGTRAKVLRHESSRRDHSRHKETEAGLMQITVGEVTAAALELLQNEESSVRA